MGWGQQTGPLKSDEQGGGGKKKSRSPFFSLFKNPRCQKNWRLQKCGRHTCHFFFVQMTPSDPHCPCQWTHKRVWCHLGCVGHNKFISRSTPTLTLGHDLCECSGEPPGFTATVTVTAMSSTNSHPKSPTNWACAAPVTKLGRLKR